MYSTPSTVLPHYVISQIFHSVKEAHKPFTPQSDQSPSPTSTAQPQLPSTNPTNPDNDNNRLHLLSASHTIGKTGENILRDMKRSLKSVLPPTIDTRTCYTSTETLLKIHVQRQNQSTTRTQRCHT